MNLIKILTADSQKNNDIYILIEKFYEILRFNDWLKNYIFWELDLFKTLGYHLELDKLVDKETINDVSRYISKSSFNKKIVPNFLIDKDENTADLNILLEGLKLVGDFLDKTILRPNNIKQPISRINFINSLK